MKNLITPHLFLILCVYITLAYLHFRHKFFLSGKARILLVLISMLALTLGAQFLPRDEPDALLTMREHVFPITLIFAAIVLPCAAIKYFRDHRNIFSGKLERDRDEIRR